MEEVNRGPSPNQPKSDTESGPTATQPDSPAPDAGPTSPVTPSATSAPPPGSSTTPPVPGSSPQSPPPVLRPGIPSPGPGYPRTSTSHPPNAPRGGGNRTLWWALASLVTLGALAVVALVVLFNGLRPISGGRLSGGASIRHSDLREVVVEPASTRHKIAIIDLQGVISGAPFDYLGNNLVSYIEEQLERAAEDDYVKAVILKIDSPGGEVLASDEIYKLIAEFQEDHDKPVVASMGTVAASGGYYVAAPCRWIVANELTITGSIGVIMHSYNWRGLMEKVGVRPQVFKSGVLKDMLSPDKREEDITEAERQIVQDLVDETFRRFKSVIEEGRGLAHARNEDNDGEERDQGRELARNWEDYADGRLLSGKEAHKLGFVDELGDFTDAVRRARQLGGIEDARLVQYLRPMAFGSLLRFLGQGQETRLKIDLGVELPKVRSGLYFLAPNLVR